MRLCTSANDEQVSSKKWIHCITYTRTYTHAHNTHALPHARNDSRTTHGGVRTGQMGAWSSLLSTCPHRHPSPSYRTLFHPATRNANIGSIVEGVNSATPTRTGTTTGARMHDDDTHS
jgi:hypothetical protein